MAQLHFKYSVMNSGKTIDLLKIANNYEEKGDKVCIFTPAIDNRSGKGIVSSRIGIQREAIVVEKDSDIFSMVKNLEQKISCVLVDEAQFLSREHVLQLTMVVDLLDIPVIAFGLKTDFQARLFEGSYALICFADKLEEVKTVCRKCNRKAIFNMRVDSSGKKIKEGEQIMIGGNESYISVCRKHFSEEIA